MCRLLGVVSAEIAGHRTALDGAPRSLAELSPDHPHGWGLAVSDGGRDWDVHRATSCAKGDSRFHALADRARGKVLIAHIRNRTVGPSSIENTHPFRRGRWVFAHNGTIPDTSALERRTSAARRREIEGQTDSERLFAFILSALDRAGATEGASRARVGAADTALQKAASVIRAQRGAANFLCSDGEVMYAFRFGRTLHVLQRGSFSLGETPKPPLGAVSLGETPKPPLGAVSLGETPKPPLGRGRRRAAVILTSERPTDEPWIEVSEGALLRVDGGASPTWRSLS